jgi:hypothetical protein
MANAESLLKRYRNAVGPQIDDILPKNPTDPLFPLWEEFCKEERGHVIKSYQHFGLKWPAFLIREAGLATWCQICRVGTSQLEDLVRFGIRYRPNHCYEPSSLPNLQFLIAFIQTICTSQSLVLTDDERSTLSRLAVPHSPEQNPLSMAKRMEWDLLPEPFKQTVLDGLEAWMRKYFLRPADEIPSSSFRALFIGHQAELRRYARGKWQIKDKHASRISSWLVPLCQEILQQYEDTEIMKLAQRQHDVQNRRVRFVHIREFWKQTRLDLDPERDSEMWSPEAAQSLKDDLIWACDWIRGPEAEDVHEALFASIDPPQCLHKAQKLLELTKLSPEEKAEHLKRQVEEHRQADQEAECLRKEEEMRAETTNRLKTKQQACRAMQEEVERRCRQIVKVFNGLFDCEIDPDAVLNGQVTGEYASIQSMPTSMGMHMAQRMLLTQTQHQILEGRTWLEIEEGDDEQEMRDAFESTNVLVWHELCHLVRPSAVNVLLEAVALPPDADEDAKAQARELVLDALAMRLGQIAYVHPPLGEDFPRTEEQRLQLMRRSLSAMARRVVRHLGQADLQPGQREFILRLAAELQVHAADGSARAKDALEAMQETFAPLLEQGCELQEKYAALYGYVLAMAHVTSLPFRGSLNEDEPDGRGFGCAAPTIH